MQCGDCTHGRFTGHSYHGYCSEAARLLKQAGVPTTQNDIGVRRTGDADNCPGFKERKTYTLRVVGSGQV
jgi:hypothetical protein